MTWHPIVTVLLLPDSGGVTDWYQEPRIMPPKMMMKRKAVKKMVKKQVAEAIAEYEKTRANLDNAEGSGSVNTGGVVAPNVQGCTHKTLMNEDKVMFATSTLEGRALTWWNRNVQTLGLVNANHIPCNEFKTMMTTEYCPATEIQRMEQELWTLTLKGDDIKAYNNRFHELDLMCPDLVPTERKRWRGIFKGFQKESKEISLLQNPLLCMMQSTWLMNWSSKQFRVELQEFVKATKGSGKITK
ncbi:putative reverse transcriptase domain-containing protein [Tanacetum coccineum]